MFLDSLSYTDLTPSECVPTEPDRTAPTVAVTDIEQSGGWSRSPAPPATG